MPQQPLGAIEEWIATRCAAIMGVAAETLDRHQPFDAYGIASRDLVALSGELEDWLGLSLDPAVTYEYVTVADLARYLANRQSAALADVSAAAAPSVPMPHAYDHATTTDEPLALIGASGRFPGAPDLPAFWRMLAEGVDAISDVPAARRQAQTFDDQGAAGVHWGGYLVAVDQFDPLCFGISPREATRMDPQQRLLVELAWEALEDAGVLPERLADSATGVFVGIATHDYSTLQREAPDGLDIYASTGSAASIAANRISYLLNLHGPSLTVDTACSSSLVALHLACQSLRSGECSLALVGAANVILSPEWTEPFARAGLMAADGRCKTFDAAADGYVRGEGGAVVVLKRLTDARRDGDHILALLRGTAVNQDGRSNGLVAPSARAQEAVIRAALARAGVSPGAISYVEAHGTGTALGDPIEWSALKAALGEGRDPARPLTVGSVKTNIGHLEAAAGLAGLLKVVLALGHAQIPPHLHFRQLNPHIATADAPFVVPTQLRPWPRGATPRLAGVSSFGFGGTNAHVIVEEPPPDEALGNSRAWQVLTLSARTPAALDALTASLAAALRAAPPPDLADAAYTMQTGRRAFAHRRSVVCRDATDAADALSARTTGRVYDGAPDSQARRLVMLFPGLGDQYVEMARELYDHELLFRTALDRCAELLTPLIGHDLRELLYPQAAAPPAPRTGGLDLRAMLGRSAPQAQPGAESLNHTAIAHPVLFAVEYALAQLWMAWGLRPQAMVGYSIGEYVAATLAGVFTLEDALRLVARRAQLIEQLPGGAMLAVPLSEAELAPLLSDGLWVAAINGAGRCVVAGSAAAVGALDAALQGRELACRRLATAHAFHSPMMDPIAAAFAAEVAAVRREPPRLPFISNVSGDWITDDEATDPAYWARHLCQAVRFGDALARLAQTPGQTLLEVGPGQTLCSLAWHYAAEHDLGDAWAILPTMRHVYDRQPDHALALTTLGRLWLAGHPIDWEAFYAGQRRRRIALPTSPYARERCWIERQSVSRPSAREVSDKGDLAVIAQTTTRPASAPRGEQLAAQIRVIVAGLLQTGPERIDSSGLFLEMGADSIILAQAIRTIEKTFGVEIGIRQLFEELTTIDAVAAYLDRQLPPGWGAAPEAAAPPVVVARTEPAPLPTVVAPATSAAPGVEQVVAQQLALFAQMTEVMSRQLTALAGQPLTTPQIQAPPALNGVAPNGAAAHLAPPAPWARPIAAAEQPAAGRPYVPYQPISVERRDDRLGELGERQRRYLAAFIQRFTERTQRSKQRAQAYRQPLADNRASVGFRFSIKELLYPLVAERSRGSRIWDIDGNEYLDLTMGFGVNLLGHSPPCVEAALAEQLGKGIQLGPQSYLAPEVAELVCRLTGMERVAFSNSGTEAVMIALRLARTATGRKKIALFAGSYHGISDGTLVVADVTDGVRRSAPMAPGVLPGVEAHVLVLDYGTPEALAALREHAHELAAVLVEPVQSRRPGLQPRAFLHELRELTAASGIALIFDEMITGFRCHPGGAQAWFGVEADLAAYGKVAGGGMPIGIVAGRAAWMGGIDGGMWQFGDGSFPAATTTFFAGTFCKHPLTMAASYAVLSYLHAQGPALQAALNARTTALAGRLNAYFAAEAVPIRVEHFASLMRFSFSANMDLFFYHLVEKGLYVWEGRTLFLSTAHTDEDLAEIEALVRASIDDLRQGGFLPERPGRGPGGEPERGAEPPRELPLTAMQQEIWLQCQMSSSAAMTYHNPVLLRLHGALDQRALGDALGQVVARHEALRTVFDPEGRHQIVLQGMAVELAQQDFAGLSEAARGEAIERWLVASSHQLFDLSGGPLLRASLLRVADHEHILVVIAHQIIADGISIALLVREISELYSAARRGVAAELPEPLSLSEYVGWHHDLLRGPRTASATTFWAEEFVGEIPEIDLPTDRPRRPLEAYAACRRSIHVAPALYAQLQQVSARHQATLFMSLLTAFKTLLYRLTGQEDLIVGAPIAGRPDTDGRHLIGGCINLFPIRSRLHGDQEFTQALATVRGSLLRAYDHAHYPFGMLVRKVNPRRDPGRWPLISVFFNLDRPQETPTFVDLRCELLPHPVSYANFDLNVNVLQLPDSLTIELDYNQELFDAATIERWVAYFTVLLESIVVDPHQRLSALPLIGDEEHHRLIRQWNPPGATPPVDLHIPALFEHWAAATPAAAAVVAPGQTGPAATLSYGELNARANQLARHLGELGVEPETVVGICIERSPTMVVALLAVLKAGGAYLPLDPAYPRQRLAAMLHDARATLVLSEARLAELMPASGVCVVLLDDDRQLIARQADTNLLRPLNPEQLAYIIFTSGSTGRPKGVMVRHGSLASAFFAWEQLYGLRDEARIHLQMAGFSFDVCTGDIVRALCSGGRLVLCPREVLLAPEQLYQLLHDEQVDCAEFVPAVLRGLMDEMEQSARRLVHMRVLICGSDRWHIDEYRRFQGLCGERTRLINSFGVTEATIDSTSFEHTAPELEHGRLVPIGRPLANTHVYVLNAALQPAPVGVTGEIYIGGAGVARGYSGRPDLTAARFIPDPFHSDPGRRLYRTGDYGRYLADGTIEFIGRGDTQIKIRGQRIELGEIEAVLQAHPAVSQVVALAHGGSVGGVRMVAYVALRPWADGDEAGADELARALRAYAVEHLPDVMVPAVIVLCAALPLTPNGKVDRAALLALAPDPSAEEVTYVAPQTPTEQRVAAIWAEVLDVERVGSYDNFFSLGGHSLLVTKVVARVRSALGVELPLRALFETPSVAGMAAMIDALSQGGQAAPSGGIPRADRSVELPLSSSQQRLWFVEQLAPSDGAYAIANALQLDGRLDVMALERSLRLVIERHETLRSAFAVEDGRPRQVLAPSVDFALDISDLTHLAGPQHQAEVTRRAISAAARPFDLARGPLLRAELLRLRPEQHVLLLSIHHIVADGWSMGVLIGEIAAIYPALRGGETPALAALPIQYADYATWQQRRLADGALDGQLAYWRGQLTGAPQALDLPADRQRPEIQSYRGATLRAPLPHHLSAGLARLGRRLDATPFMTLLATFGILLSRYSDQTDLVIGTPIANRTLAELEPLIGFFVNTLALRIDLAGNPRFDELIARLRGTMLDAYANQDLPFERLVDELQITRDLKRHPLFQVAFVLHNTPTAALDLPELRLSVLPIDYGSAKFDLTLQVEQEGDGLLALFEYNCDLFDAPTVARMRDHFLALLEAVVADPAQTIADLPMLTPAEGQLLADWNRTATGYPPATTIPQLFDEQAARTPGATALCCGDERYSYAELALRANQLAWHLRALGVGPDTLVAVCLERSSAQIVALLAILKAGGAYVPLDLSYPAERLRFMLDDTAAPVVITTAALLGALPLHGAQSVCLDRDAALIVALPGEHPPATAQIDNLAYVSYTSGSTGRPKGVRVTHRGVVRLVYAPDFARFSPDDVVTQIAPIAFDASTLEIWGALLNGARLVLYPERTPALADLAWLITTERVSILWATTGLFHQLVDHQPDCLLDVRQVLTGGEVLSVPLARKLLALRREGVVVNAYGPTENTTFTTCHPMTRIEDVGDPAPIGRPIADTQVYILDRRLRPAPLGVPGELYAGGDGLARDYLNRPELTAERFLPDPFSARPGARMYRTGDLARWRADGRLEFIGRIDQQVKIRGFRIEPGEIESALEQHPQIQDATVLAREDRPGVKRLVAYVVPLGAEAVAADELRAFLAARLPEYMIPTAYVVIGSLPLTPSGKVDRRALPEPAPESWHSADDLVAPRDQVEQTLAAVWAQTLGLEQVGIHDNFFALGGDSILSIQIVARLNQAGLRLQPKHLFQHQTIAELAAVVNSTPQIQAEQGLVQGEAPLTPIQRWLFEQAQPRPAHFNQALLLEVRAALGPELIARALNVLVEHHDALRLRFTYADDGTWTQRHAAPGAALVLEHIDLVAHHRREDGGCFFGEGQALPVPLPADIPHNHCGEPLGATPDAELAAALEAATARAQAGLELASGPLLRAVYIERGERSGRLLLVAHHLLVDGVSWRVLVGALQQVCEQLRAGQPAQLPPKTSSYQQWARHLEQHARTTELRAEQRYWLDLPWARVVPLPVDVAALAEANSFERAATVTVRLDEAATTALLRELSEAHRAQVPELLLYALCEVLTAWAGGDTQLIDLESHGREPFGDEIDLSRTVGWFTVIAPLVLSLEGCATPEQRLAAVKEQMRRMPNHGVGYGLLRYLADDPELAARLRSLPQPGLSFNYLGQIDQGQAAGALFALAAEPTGADVAGSNRRAHLIDITGQVASGQLELSWVYCQATHRRETVEGLAEQHLAALRALIGRTQAGPVSSVTPSDFPLAAIDATDLTSVLSLFNLEE